MSARRWLDRLAGRKVALDLGVFQVYLHGDPAYQAVTLPLFEAIERGRLTAVTSVLTLSELLVEPYQAGNSALAKEYNFLWPTFPHLTLVPVNAAIADRAAQSRSRHMLSLLQSVQMATALYEGADALVATDPTWRRATGDIDLLILEDCL